MKKQIFLIIPCIFLSCTSVLSQTASELLNKSLHALGNWTSVRNFEYTAVRRNIDKWQSYDFSRPRPEKDLFKLYFDLKQQQFLHHTENHYPGGYLFDTYRLGRDSTYFVYDGLGSRTGRDLLDLGSSSFEGRKNTLLKGFPYFLLKDALSKGNAQVSLGQDGTPGIFIKTEKGSEEYQLDKATGLLRAYIKKDGPNTILQTFDDYRPVEGLMLSQHNELQVNGNIVYKEELTSFKYNKNIEPAVFAFPKGYTRTLEESPKLSAKEIAKDVYLIEKVDADRNILFVNMGTYIVLSEAPLAPGLTRAILDVVHSTLPGIPVKYVHLSHFHNDHIAGLAELAKEGVSIICAEDMQKPVKDMLAAYPDKSLELEKKAKLVLFKNKKVLEDASHQLIFLEIPNSHAKGLSLIYLPKEQLIYQGDLLSLPSDGYLTPAIPVTREFGKYLAQNKISFNRIIGHHGLPIITKTTFDQILNMK